MADVLDTAAQWLLPDGALTGFRLILAAWIGLALVITGLGVLVQRAWRTPLDGAAWILCFWLGWASLLLVLQLWHFVLPVDDRALGVIVLAGVLGLLLAGRRPWVVFARGLRCHLPVLIVLCLTTIWLAKDRAMCPIGNGDTGYYFAPTIAWLRAYPIVPGLANLSAPLAYNQTYFHYVALLEAGPFVHGAHHLANGLLLLALFARGLLGASRTFRSGGGLPADIFYLASLPAAVRMAFSYNFTSPAPDFAVFVMGVVLAGEWIALLTGDGDPREGLRALAVLAAAAITVKLSLAALAVATLMSASAVALWRGVAIRSLAGALALGLLWIAAWVAGHLVMSGYPFYPSTLAGLPLPWRVPADVSEMIRESSSLHGSIALAWRDPRWFLNSLDSLGWKTPDVLLPLAMTAAAIIVGPLLWVIRRHGERRPGLPLVTLVPTLAALVFWFVMAPRPRFAGAAFWLLGIQALLIALGGTIAGRSGRGAVAALATTLTALAFYDGGRLNCGLPRFQLWPPPVLKEEVLASGLVVSVPKGQLCWDALLCTPTPNAGLTLLHPGDPGGGFRIDPSIPSTAAAGRGAP